jgi:hypothetical protein
MLILLEVVLTKRALLILIIFSYPLLFAGLFRNNLQLLNPPRRLGMQLLLSNPWIVHSMRDFGVIFERVSLMCDNTRAISVAKNPVLHKRMKLLEVRYHFLRDHVEKGDIEMNKSLNASRFAALRREIGVCHSYGLI